MKMNTLLQTDPAQLPRPPGAAALQLLEWIAQQDGKMINGNRLSREAKAALADLRVAMSASAPTPAEGFYVACFKRHNGLVQWWRPECKGYTPYLEQAGIYTAAQLHEEGDYLDNEYTVPVPVAFVAPHVNTLVDHGMTINKAFQSAGALRAALQASNAGDLASEEASSVRPERSACPSAR